MMKSNLVYEIGCSCGSKYIGCTRRNLIGRFEEHLKTTTSTLTAIGQHLKDNPDHVVSDSDVIVLGYSSYQNKLFIKESLYIQEKNPNLNNQMEFKKNLIVFNTQ